MRFSKHILILPIILVLLSLFSIHSVAQEKEDEENDTIRNLRRSAALFFSRGINDSLNYIYNNRELLDMGSVRINYKNLPLGGRIEVETPHMPFVPSTVFSTVLPNPYAGSPAYEIVNTWRNSLNIDVVTGKYYWEW